MREIDEQYAEAEWTLASTIPSLPIPLPFLALGVHVLVTAGAFWEVVTISAIFFGVWILFLKVVT